MKDKMTWEETIEFIRTKPEFTDLVDKAYFAADLPVNVEKFKTSEEFIETLKLIKLYAPDASKILDIGSGNGITAISFALGGYQVDTVEPDPSATIGAGAIRKLKEHFKLNNITVYEAFAEEIHFQDHSFDIVFARQCMHHAYNLDKFVLEASRVLKPGGLFITVRDHVIYNETDKKWFLETHPLQKYYGGENAFTNAEYTNAINKAGLDIKLVLKHYDSVINYFPFTKYDKEHRDKEFELLVQSIAIKKIGLLYRLPFVKIVIDKIIKSRLNKPLNEEYIPGRMYTYLAIKK